MSSIALIHRWLTVASLAGLVAGCTVHPPGEREERDAALQSGKPFDQRIESRQLPDLPENPTPDQLVTYALVANAELEQSYWEWRSAIEQIPQDGTQSATLNFSAGTAITNGHASWNSSTVALSNDPMTDIKWPGKLDAAAKQALQNAKAAGQRFLKAKYELRGKVLDAYYDYALNAEQIRLEQANEQLLQTTAGVTEARNRSGNAGLPDVMKASNEVDMSRNNISNMQSQLPGQRAAINALLSRPADAPLPSELPTTRPLAYADGELVTLAAKQNPELVALADEIQGRQEGIRLAKLQYVPDFNFSAGTDLAGMTQSILGQATIPIFRHQALDAAINQAEANLRASEALRRQTANDLVARVVTDITALRDAERQLDLFEQTILPRARQIVEIDRSSYETGRISLLDVLEDQRYLITIERLVANLRIARERHLVDLETTARTNLSRLSSESPQRLSEPHLELP